MEWDSLPIVTAEITFLHTEEGGRSTLPVFDSMARYMPHVVVQDRATRKARFDRDSVILDLYLAVAFFSGPGDFKLGNTAVFQFSLMRFPEVDYSAVKRGATFTVREGGKIVAHGLVLDRRDPIDS